MNVAEIIERVCAEAHVPMVEAAFGKRGVDAVFEIMVVTKSLYTHVELERVGGKIVIFKVVGPHGASPAPASVPAADFAALANLPITDLVLEIASDGRAYLRTALIQPLEELAKNAVVYHWAADQDEFLAGGGRRSVPRLDQAARSQFAVPTFSNLREALQHYARENIRESTCYLFRKIWRCDNRLFLIAGPEDIMRDSLTQFLRNRIGGDHDVFPEQNVNEKNPIDIRVNPRFTNNRLMLIEIKWLGYSVAEDGHITARHKDRRAQEGADQLAKYLDEQRTSAPSRVIQGYYVIIDGRRENLSEGATTITSADGMFYEDKDLVFNPDHYAQRNDFDRPYRMFARPVCTG
jgi:hypothetical protein